MAVSCDPNDLIQAASCNRCISHGDEGPVIIYLLQQIAGNTMTPDQLMQAASCLRCIPAGIQSEIQTYLLCAIVNK